MALRAVHPDAAEVARDSASSGEINPGRKHVVSVEGVVLPSENVVEGQAGAKLMVESEGRGIDGGTHVVVVEGVRATRSRSRWERSEPRRKSLSRQVRPMRGFQVVEAEVVEVIELYQNPGVGGRLPCDGG